MKRYNITTKKTFIYNGEEKTYWNNVGKLVQLEDGKFILELSMFFDIKFYVFDDKPRDSRYSPNPKQHVAKKYPEAKQEETISIEDIPF